MSSWLFFKSKDENRSARAKKERIQIYLNICFYFGLKNGVGKIGKKNSILTEILKPKMCLSLIFSFREHMKLMTLMALICFQG